MEKRIRRKDLIREIELIRVKTNELKQIVDSLPLSTVKKAFEQSVTNLEKKIEKFSKVSERLVLSDEEKVLISKFRAEKAATETQVHEVSPDVYVREDAKQKKKK